MIHSTVQELPSVTGRPVHFPSCTFKSVDCTATDYSRATQRGLGNTLPTLRKPCWTARTDGEQIAHGLLLSYVISI